MKIVTVVGARPQFIKAAALSCVLRRQTGVQEVLIHTGQHFDNNMSRIFFEEMDIPKPDYNLEIAGLNHGAMTGRMLERLEQVFMKEVPDRVLIYGDTNSTLAAALAASKLHIPIAHVEAGLRSFNMQMPEEINRIVADRLSDKLFCPTDTAVQNLLDEGYGGFDNVEIVKSGDVMQDTAMLFAQHAISPGKSILAANFVLATLHRAENTDNPAKLRSIVNALNEIHNKVAPVVLPLHPRTRGAIKKTGLALEMMVIDPVGYLEMIWLLKHCELVLTDSGGLQKEAYFFGQPCVTMREQTEWVELVDVGANELVGADSTKIFEAASRNIGRKVQDPHQLYGGGEAAKRIVGNLLGVCDDI